MPELKPVLSELLRTCVHPPSLLLKVAHVEFVNFKNSLPENVSHSESHNSEDSRSSDRYATKFLLTDGHLMIQALLHRRLSTLRDAADIEAGDLLDIRRFGVKKSPRTSGQGRIVYLSIEDCTFLLQRRRQPEKHELQRTSEGARKRKASPVENTEVKRNKTSGDNEKRKATDLLEESPVKRVKLNLDDTNVEKSENQADPPRFPSDGPACNSKTYVHTPRPQQSSKVMAKDGESAKLEVLYKKKFSGSGILSDQKSISTTFGARKIPSDDEDEGADFFDSVKAEPSVVQRRRQALSGLKGNRTGKSEETAEDLVSSKLDVDVRKSVATGKGETVASKTDDLGFEESKHRPQPVSKRDGTFALSQLPPSLLSAQQSHHIRPEASTLQPQKTIHQPTQPILLPSPPFHTLRQLRYPSPTSPLPTKSYTVSILAVVSWTGATLIQRPGSAFPPKRHLKIVDPSLSHPRPQSREEDAQRATSSYKPQTAFQDAVTVAVYLDASTFKPLAGTVALFRGLVMQRLGNGDIILNAYARLKEQRFEEPAVTVPDQGSNATSKHRAGLNVPDHDNMHKLLQLQATEGDSENHWFITNHDRIRSLGYGSKLDYYLEWWREKQGHNTNSGT